MLISALAFTLMNVTAKKMADYNAFQMVFFRALWTLVFTLTYLLRNKVTIWGTHKKLLFIRSFVGLTSMTLFFTSLHYLPVGTAVTLRYLSPIFAAIFSIFLLKEKIIPIRWVFFIIAFSGVVILRYADLEMNLIGLGIILASAVFSGFVYISISKIGTKEHPYTIVNHFMMITAMVGGLAALFNWKTPESEDYLPLLSMGVYGFFGQLYMTKALQIASVNKVAPIKYMEVVFTLLVGVSFFGEAYSVWSLLGIALIIIGLMLNLLYKKSNKG